MRQARLPSHRLDLLVDLQCDNGGVVSPGGCQEKSSSHFFLMAWQRPKYLALQTTNKNKNTTLHAEGILGLEGREEKNNENKG